MSSTPLQIINNALTALSQVPLALSAASETARQDLADAQERARREVTDTQEVAQREVAAAHAEVRQLRRERDEATKALQTAQAQQQTWKQEAEELRATKEKAEMAISHHKDTIAQLRNEIEHWRKQCTRQEEAAHREIEDWKDQLMRVEKERSRLAKRAEELVDERAMVKSIPLTPVHKQDRLRNPIPMVASFPSALRATSSKLPPPPAYDDYPDPGAPVSAKQRSRIPSNTKPPAQVLSSATRSRIELDSAQSTSDQTSAQLQPRARAETKLIRKVHAVISVPVKEEEDEHGQPLKHSQWEGDEDEDEEEEDDDMAAIARGRREANERTAGWAREQAMDHRPRANSMPSRRGNARRKSAAKVISYAEPPEGEEFSASEAEEDEDGEPEGCRRAPLRADSFHAPSDDDDDELMMRGPVKPSEVYRSNRPLASTSAAQPESARKPRAHSPKSAPRRREQPAVENESDEHEEWDEWSERKAKPLAGTKRKLSRADGGTAVKARRH